MNASAVLPVSFNSIAWKVAASGRTPASACARIVTPLTSATKVFATFDGVATVTTVAFDGVVTVVLDGVVGTSAGTVVVGFSGFVSPGTTVSAFESVAVISSSGFFHRFDS